MQDTAAISKVALESPNITAEPTAETLSSAFGRDFGYTRNKENCRPITTMSKMVASKALISSSCAFGNYEPTETVISQVKIARHPIEAIKLDTTRGTSFGYVRFLDINARINEVDTQPVIWQKLGRDYLENLQVGNKQLQLTAVIDSLTQKFPATSTEAEIALMTLSAEERKEIAGMTIATALSEKSATPVMLSALAKIGKIASTSKLTQLGLEKFTCYSQDLQETSLVSCLKWQFANGDYPIFAIDQKYAVDTFWSFKIEKNNETIIETRGKFAIKPYSFTDKGIPLELDPIEFYVNERLSYDYTPKIPAVPATSKIQLLETDTPDPEVHAFIQDLLLSSDTLTNLALAVGDKQVEERRQNLESETPELVELKNRKNQLQTTIHIKTLGLSAVLLQKKLTDPNLTPERRADLYRQQDILLHEFEAIAATSLTGEQRRLVEQYKEALNKSMLNPFIIAAITIAVLATIALFPITIPVAVGLGIGYGIYRGFQGISWGNKAETNSESKQATDLAPGFPPSASQTFQSAVTPHQTQKTDVTQSDAEELKNNINNVLSDDSAVNNVTIVMLNSSEKGLRIQFSSKQRLNDFLEYMEKYKDDYEISRSTKPILQVDSKNAIVYDIETADFISGMLKKAMESEYHPH